MSEIFLPSLTLLFATFYTIISDIKFENNFFRKILLGITGIIFAISLVSIMNQKALKDEENSKQDERFINTTSKLDSSSKQIDTALDSLKSIQKSANIIIDSMSKQLSSQIKLYNTTQKIMNQSQDILFSQKEITNIITPSLDALSPLEIEVNLEIPFDFRSEINSWKILNKLNSIKNYVENNKKGVERYSDSIEIWYKSKDKVSSFDFYNIHKFLQIFGEDSGYVDNIFKGAYSIYFMEKNKINLKKYKEENIQFQLFPQFHEVYFNAQISFEDKMIYVQVIDPNAECNNIVGFDDIKNDAVFFIANSRILNYYLKSIKLKQKNGLQKKCTINFNEKEGMSMKIKNIFGTGELDMQKIYLHKMTKKEFY
ncbi:MAG: hypothetical protein V4556_07650 [Bacteroidota bacterium]